MISHNPITYYMINETVTTEESSRKFFEILEENVVTVGGTNLFTLTWRQLLSECDVRNFNGRIYKTADMWNAWTTNPLIKRDLETTGVIGEYGHPQIEKGTNELARQLTIDPQKSCWSIKNLEKDNNKIWGRVTTLSGGWGDVVRDRALTGTVPMASTRAIGGCDSNGNVMPGFTMVTADCVFRCSSQNALADMSTMQVNTFNVPKGNSMSESATAINVNSEGFKNFLLTESVTRDKIHRVCDTLRLDYDTIALHENTLTITRLDENQKTTLVMPLSKLVGVNHHNLF